MLTILHWGLFVQLCQFLDTLPQLLFRFYNYTGVSTSVLGLYIRIAHLKFVYVVGVESR